jgi:hypothetical protein
MIRFWEFIGSVWKDDFDMESWVRVDVFQDVFWKAIEEELDLIKKEPAKQGPVADLGDILYRIHLLTLLGEIFKDEEETLVQQGNPSGTG